MIVQIKTFYVVAQKNKALPIHTRMQFTQERLEEQINKFIRELPSVYTEFQVGDIRIWSGVDPLSLHGMVVYQVKE